MYTDPKRSGSKHSSTPLRSRVKSGPSFWYALVETADSVFGGYSIHGPICGSVSPSPFTSTRRFHTIIHSSKSPCDFPTVYRNVWEESRPSTKTTTANSTCRRLCSLAFSDTCTSEMWKNSCTGEIPQLARVERQEQTRWRGIWRAAMDSTSSKARSPSRGGDSTCTVRMGGRVDFVTSSWERGLIMKMLSMAISRVVSVARKPSRRWIAQEQAESTKEPDAGNDLNNSLKRLSVQENPDPDEKQSVAEI